MTNSEAQLPPRPPPHPPPRAEDWTKLGWVIAGTLIALLGSIALFAMGDDGTYPDVKAQDAAIVGDVVTVRGAASTVLCEDRNDASNIHMTGEIAMRQSNLFDKDAGKAVMKREAARNSVMRQAHSCHRAPHGVRYTVRKKEMVGTESDDFRVVAYCLQPNGTGTCFWVQETFDGSAPSWKTADKS